MQEISGVAMIAAAVLLLLATRRACARGDGSWITSDTFVLSVVGPGFLVSLVGGGATLYYSSINGESVSAAIAGAAFAAVVGCVAAAEWLHASRVRDSAIRGPNVVELAARQPGPAGQPTEPDAPRPPVPPHTRRAA